MDTIVQDPEVQKLVKGVSLRYLLNAYFFFKPNVSQTEMGKRLNVGQMTISRMLTKEYEVRDEWVPAVFDMLCELNQLGIKKYASKVKMLQTTCENIALLSQFEEISSFIYEYILSKESKDFERMDISRNGFRYFSWEKKITWAFVNVSYLRKQATPWRASKGAELESRLEVYFPKRTDRVTLFVTNAEDFEYARDWYNSLDWTDSGTNYLLEQEHTIMQIDIEEKSIKELKYKKNNT